MINHLFDKADLPKNPNAAVSFLIETLGNTFMNIFTEKGIYTDFLGGFRVYISTLILATEKSTLNVSIKEHILNFCNGKKGYNYSNVGNFIQDYYAIEATLEIENHFEDFSEDNTFTVSLEQREFIILRCNEIRKAVHHSVTFDQDHKVRLLKRISKVEEEVYKQTGNFDAILGGVVDFGEAFGKFGKAIKPLVDRYSEIRAVAQKGAPEYKALPAPDEPKRLPPPSEDSEAEDQTTEA